MAFPKFLRAGSAAAIALLLAGCDDSTGPALCTTIRDYSIGQTITESLSAGDCETEGGSFIDFYQLTAPSQMSVEFSLSSGAFDPFILLLRGAGFGALTVAGDGDELSTVAAVHVLMAPDTYVVAANSFSVGETGSYALSSTQVSDQALNCAEIWVTHGIATAQTIETTDCVATVDGDTIYSDEFLVVLGAGESITATMTSTAVDSFLELYNSRGVRVAFNDNFDTGLDARIVYNAPVEDVFFIVATTFDPDTTGAYALTIN